MSESDSSEIEVPEKFFTECLELGVCAQCCKNKENIFLFPGTCDHRLCVDCCLALPLESEMQKCPTCKKPFQTQMLTPDFSFKSIWKEFQTALDQRTFRKLVEQNEVIAVEVKYLRASSIDKESPISKKVSPRKKNAASSDKSEKTKSARTNLLIVSDEKIDNVPTEERAGSQSEPEFLGFASPLPENPQAVLWLAEMTTLNREELDGTSSRVTSDNNTFAKKSATVDITPVTTVTRDKPRRFRLSGSANVSSNNDELFEKSAEVGRTSGTSVTNDEPRRDLPPKSAKATSIDDELPKVVAEEQRTPDPSVTKRKHRRGRPPGSAKVTYNNDELGKKSVEIEKTPGTSVSTHKRRRGRPPGSTKATSNNVERPENSAEVEATPCTPMTQDQHRRGRPPGSVNVKTNKNELAEKIVEVGTTPCTSVAKYQNRRGRPHGSAKTFFSRRTISTSSEEDLSEPRGQPFVDDKQVTTTSPLAVVTPRSRFLKRNSKQETALHEYVSLGCQNKRAFSIMKLQQMLEDGANPNTVDGSGITPLHESIICTRIDITKVLLARGALVNCYRSDLLWTPLHEAVNRWIKSTDVTEQSIPYRVLTLLLDCGADLNLKDGFRRTPRDLAVTNPAIFNLLITYNPKLTERVEMLAAENPMVILFCTSDSKKLSDVAKKFAFTFKLKCLPGQLGFKSDVTHLVVKTGTKRANHVMRLGMLSGCYIVTMKWVTDSLERGELMPEGGYELPEPLIPNSCESFVTRKARMDRLHMRPKLFTGGQFHLLACSPDEMTKQSRFEIHELIKCGGGEVLQREPKDHKLNEDLPKLFHARDDSDFKDCSVLLLYARAPMALFKMPEIKHAPISWFLDCVDTYSILPEYGVFVDEFEKPT